MIVDGLVLVTFQLYLQKSISNITRKLQHGRRNRSSRKASERARQDSESRWTDGYMPIYPNKFTLAVSNQQLDEAACPT